MIVARLSAVLILWTAISGGNSARILGIFHVPSRSHHILGSKLLLALAERGHEVTMVSPYPFKNKVKNYRDVFLKEMLEYKEEHMFKVLQHNVTLSEQMRQLSQMFWNISEIFLSNGGVQQLKNEKFDLVIQYAMMTGSFLGLAHSFGAPVILLNTMGSISALDKIMGNTAPPSYVPSLSLYPLSDEMTFLERVWNTLSVWLYYGLLSYLGERQEQQLLSKYFPEAPSLHELLNNVALVFLNSHYSIESPRPYVPNMIQIGGFHVDEPKQLPPDLKRFLDGATNGAIFFSLGSNVKISSLPEEKIEAVISVFGRLEMKVLFKSDRDLPALPKNIKVGKWLPQNDILAHPNVKLFVSHGGLLSTIEAVYHGVPVVGIPIFGDQRTNVDVAEANGYALKMELDELTEESFSNALDEILTNPKYRDNIKLKSSLMRDQPVKPLEKAVFWVEHVLKHKGAKHLKNAGTKLALYQYLLLDVIVFVAAVCVAVSTIFYFVFKRICRCVKNLRKSKSKND